MRSARGLIGSTPRISRSLDASLDSHKLAARSANVATVASMSRWIARVAAASDALLIFAAIPANLETLALTSANVDISADIDRTAARLPDADAVFAMVAAKLTIDSAVVCRSAKMLASLATVADIPLDTAADADKSPIDAIAADRDRDTPRSADRSEELAIEAANSRETPPADTVSFI